MVGQAAGEVLSALFVPYLASFLPLLPYLFSLLP
jgi:hypothetical protein